jgi:hypothetical protein
LVSPRFVGLILALAIGWSTAADCLALPSASAPAMSMACCKTAIRECASATDTSSCCRSNDQDHQWFGGKTSSISQPLFSVEAHSSSINVWAREPGLQGLSLLTAARAPDVGAPSRAASLRI